MNKKTEIKKKIIGGIKVYISCMVTWSHLGFKSVMGTKLRGKWN